MGLARKVAGNYPSVGILIVSGQVRPAFTDMPLGARFLAKPYTGPALAGVVRQMQSGVRLGYSPGSL